MVEWREDGGPDRGSIGSRTSGAGSGRVPGGKGLWRRAGVGNHAGERSLWIAAGDRSDDCGGTGHCYGVIAETLWKNPPPIERRKVRLQARLKVRHKVRHKVRLRVRPLRRRCDWERLTTWGAGSRSQLMRLESIFSRSSTKRGTGEENWKPIPASNPITSCCIRCSARVTRDASIRR